MITLAGSGYRGGLSRGFLLLYKLEHVEGELEISKDHLFKLCCALEQDFLLKLNGLYPAENGYRPAYHGREFAIDWYMYQSWRSQIDSQSLSTTEMVYKL